mmetsp:Transcript_5617/g.6135  ORF Transcript_5617/g.6135 Transcript_5617/m.6135 type:complete len:105 (-) Transcript_5617:510-824(-)
MTLSVAPVCLFRVVPCHPKGARSSTSFDTTWAAPKRPLHRDGLSLAGISAACVCTGKHGPAMWKPARVGWPALGYTVRLWSCFGNPDDQTTPLTKKTMPRIVQI